jgi:hypothetical protein
VRRQHASQSTSMDFRWIGRRKMDHAQNPDG